MNRYAIRFQWNYAVPAVNRLRFLRPDGFLDSRPWKAWSATSPRKARQCARLLNLTHYNIVRLPE